MPESSGAPVDSVLPLTELAASLAVNVQTL